MRILLVTDGLFPFVMGGMQKHSYYLAMHLAKKGASVEVVHCCAKQVGGHEHELMGWEGEWARRITFTQVPFPVLKRLPGHYLRANGQYSTAVYDRLRERVAGFDLIYCQGFTASAFIRGRKRGDITVPVVANLHGYEMFQTVPSWRYRLARHALRRKARAISRGADAVFSFGGRITDILIGMGVERGRILECPIGIDDNWLVKEIISTGQGTRNFLFVGRDERRKGFRELQEAIRLLAQGAVNPFSVHFIGPGHKGDTSNGGQVVYHGAISDEEQMMALFRGAHVLVCPSFSEGMPTVIMEAMASGLAIIATDVGAVSQQVGTNGWLLPAPVPTLIAHAMKAALELPMDQLDAKRRESLGKVRANFTWERVIERKLRLLEGLCAGNDRPPRVQAMP